MLSNFSLILLLSSLGMVLLQEDPEQSSREFPNPTICDITTNECTGQSFDLDYNDEIPFEQ